MTSPVTAAARSDDFRAPATEEQVAQFTLHAPPRPIVLTVVRCADRSFGFRLDCSPGCLLSDRNLDALRRMLREGSAAAFEAELAERRKRARDAVAPRTAGVPT